MASLIAGEGGGAYNDIKLFFSLIFDACADVLGLEWSGHV